MIIIMKVKKSVFCKSFECMNFCIEIILILLKKKVFFNSLKMYNRIKIIYHDLKRKPFQNSIEF